MPLHLLRTLLRTPESCTAPDTSQMGGLTDLARSTGQRSVLHRAGVRAGLPRGGAGLAWALEGQLLLQ